MREIVMAALLAAAAAGTAAAQDPGADAPVSYDVSFDDAVHHEARIVATFRHVPAGALRVQMARASPGRYALHEFAKNVYSVAATDGAGRALPVERTDPYGWSVAGHDGTVRVAYTLFGDRGDGTYAQIDATHAHLNMPATFIWASGYGDRAIRVTFRPFDPRWKIATQLPAAREANTFWAPNLQYFMDSPTELSDFGLREWTVQRVDGTPATIRLAVHHTGSEADLDRLAALVKRLIPQHRAVFGEWPAFDHGSYTFIADYMPQASGDGMEHRNSTIVTDDRSLAAADFAQLQTISHEFTHAWNVERLRPRELEPFDFTRANPTPSLWFAEGFTNYYGPLMVRRAGEMSVADYLLRLSRGVDAVLNAPARRYGSPQEMSLRAPFVDAATAIDPVAPHIFLSYYTYGEVIALALDLTLRQRFPAVTLDQVMRHLWLTHGATERPYVPADLRAALAQVTGDRPFADAFFAATVEGSALPDLAPLLAQAGLVLRRAHPDGVSPSLRAFAADGGTVTLAQSPPPGSPLYLAGAEQGDRIVAIGDTPVTALADVEAALRRLRPGVAVTVRFVQRGAERRATLRAVADPTLEVVAAEAAGRAPSAAQRRFRARWLGDDAPPG